MTANTSMAQRRAPMPPAPPPGSPTPAERRREIAHLLAIAYWRLQAETTVRVEPNELPQSDLTGAPGRA